MEWQQLKYFQVVAKMQHMTRAAEALSISQPALSRSIARLEDELGVPLFERQGRTIMLNRYGRLFLKRADTILKEMEEGKKELIGLQDPDSGEVSLGFLHTLGSHIIPNLIRSFRNNFPKVKFELNQDGSESLLRDLERGVTDLCLVSTKEKRNEIMWVKLWSEELFIIAPKTHPFAARESIALEETADESFIFFKRGIGIREITDQLCQEAGITPKITFEGEEIGTVAGLVSSGMGIAIIPNIKGIDWSIITKIPVSRPKCKREIGIAWVEGRYLSPATQRFRQFIIDYFKTQNK